MKRFVFTILISLVAFLACLSYPSTGRAAEVTLTTGSVVVNCTGNPNANTGTIDLTAPDFNLHFSYDGSGAPCSPAPVFRSLSFGPVYDGSIASATFQGVTTMFTRGFLTFNETSITGLVEGFDISDFVRPIFSVNFNGGGIGVITQSRSTFNVNAVPEPTTLVLFGAGAALLGGARRWRNRRRQSDFCVELQDG